VHGVNHVRAQRWANNPPGKEERRRKKAKWKKIQRKAIEEMDGLR